MGMGMGERKEIKRGCAAEAFQDGKCIIDRKIQ
jgi:hypothetical protein